MSKLLTFILALLFCSSALADQSAYSLGSGDMISIVVFDEADLTMDVRVTQTPLNYPFLGPIPLSNRTPEQVETDITEGLRGDYLIEPRVSVSITEYRPFFISGEVQNPGSYPYQPGLTLRKAVSLGGGFTERASRTKIYVSRGGSGATPERIDLDSPIYPDDVLTVEQSFF